MVVRSSRMQRTRTIAAAIKSIYYARVCYIRATYSLPLSVSFSLSLSRLFSSMHTHSLIFCLTLFFSFSLHTLSLYIVNSYLSFSLYHTLYFSTYLSSRLSIVIIVIIIINMIIMYSAESRHCFLFLTP